MQGTALVCPVLAARHSVGGADWLMYLTPELNIVVFVVLSPEGRQSYNDIPILNLPSTFPPANAPGVAEYRGLDSASASPA